MFDELFYLSTCTSQDLLAAQASYLASLILYSFFFSVFSILVAAFTKLVSAHIDLFIHREVFSQGLGHTLHVVFLWVMYLAISAFVTHILLFLVLVTYYLSTLKG